MVAVLQLLLSDQPPEVPRKAGLGDRFHYFRGGSGKRYLFSEVSAKDLADFRGAVAMAAERWVDGRLSANWIGAIDTMGRPVTADRRWPLFRTGTVVLVHLLAATESDRQGMLADLAEAARGPATQLALPLAA
jgi:hypothetical protein